MNCQRKRQALDEGQGVAQQIETVFFDNYSHGQLCIVPSAIKLVAEAVHRNQKGGSGLLCNKIV